MQLYTFPLNHGAKTPAIRDWENNATLDDAWWDSKHNVGCAVGRSGLVVLDFDSYKDDSCQPADLLQLQDLDTVTVFTPHGGTHLYYKMPEGYALRNRRGTLPKGVDVRGHGGYTVIPPSVLEDGGEYVFAEGRSFEDCGVRDLPDYILRLLLPRDAAPRAAIQLDTPDAEEIRKALTFIPDQPGYDVWLSVLMAVHSVLPNETGIALCEEWSPGYQGEVAKKFTTFSRQESSGITVGTLFYIASQHGYIHALPPESVVAQNRRALQRFVAWLESGEAASVIRARAGKRIVCAPLIHLLLSVCEVGRVRGSLKVYATARTLAMTLATTGQAVHRQLLKLQELGLVNIQHTDKSAGTVIDLSPLFSVTDLLPEMEEETCHAESRSFHRDHIGDDAFTNYPRRYAEKRRGRTDLLPSLGPTGLLLWGPLVQGGTAAELAEAIGMGRATVKKALERFVEVGLAEKSLVGRSSYYILVDQAEEKLDDIREHMVTAWIGQFRLARSYAQRADYAAFRLRRRHALTPRDISFWTELRDTNITRADIILDFLATVGFDGRCKVGVERGLAKRAKRRFDAVEEWRTWGRPLYDNYLALGDMPHDEKVRLLTLAELGPDSAPSRYAEARRVMRERTNLMLMLAHKRAHYDRPTVADVEELVPQAATYTQKGLDL